MSFRSSWLVALVAIAALSAAGAAGGVPLPAAVGGIALVLLVLIAHFHRRTWRIRTRDRHQINEARERAAALVDKVEALEADNERQGRAIRSLQDAHLTARRAPVAPIAEAGAPAPERVLIWRGPAQLDANLELDLLFAAELQARGAEVTLALCDGAAGCLQRRDDVRFGIEARGFTDDWEGRCGRCFSDRGLDEVRELGIHYATFNGAVDEHTRQRFRRWADETSQDEIVGFVHRGMAVGHWAASSTIRYFFGVDPMGHPRFLPMLREYFYTALLSAEAAWAVFDDVQPTRVVMQHGIYVEWGPAFELAAHRNIPLTRWCRGYTYRGPHWYVKTSDPTDRRHPHHAPERHWRRASRRPLTGDQRRRLQRYMDAQPLKANNRYVLHERAPKPPADVRAELSLPSDKPVFAVFCHLSWDAQYGFEEQTDGQTFRRWLEDTVETAIETDDVHWLIKVHPAERVNKQAVGCEEHIATRFGQLPGHVQVLSADLSINTYDLLPLLDGVVTIFGTAGLEAAMLGKKVIVAGHAHYGAKGFTFDSPTRRDYTMNLARAASLPEPTAVQIEIARRYGYDYFVTRQLPFDPTSAYRQRKQGSLDPVAARMLDKWIESVLDGSGFVMDDREVELYEEFPEVPAAAGPRLDWTGLDSAATEDEETPRPLAGVFG